MLLYRFQAGEKFERPCAEQILEQIEDRVVQSGGRSKIVGRHCDYEGRIRVVK